MCHYFQLKDALNRLHRIKNDLKAESKKRETGNENDDWYIITAPVFLKSCKLVFKPNVMNVSTLGYGGCLSFRSNH